MAEILLKYRECEERELPRVCIVCGKGRAEFVDTTLRVMVAGGPDSTTYRVVDSSLPVCGRHRSHFYRATFIALGAFGCLALVFMGIIGGTIALMPILMERIFFVAPVAIVLCVGALIGTVVVMVMASRGGVRARAINDRGVVMINVAPKFVKAVEKYRARERPAKPTNDRDNDDEADEDEDDPPPKRRRR